MTYRPEIDGLRAISVIAVMLFHGGISGFSGGFVGVDVFFVISGFLITSLIVKDLNAGKFSFWGFWERRARRILPALITVLLFTLVVGWLVLLPSDFERLGTSAFALSLFSSNLYFWDIADTSGYFNESSDLFPLIHTWSLAVEEQFYLLFPVLMFVVTRFLLRLRWLLIAGGTAGSLAVSVWLVSGNHLDAAFYLLPSRAWELGAGALLALWATRNPPSLPRVFAEPAALAGLALIGFAVFTYDANTEFPGLTAIAPVAGASLYVWSNTGRRTLAGNALSLRPVVFIGLLSYSLYLWHWPLIVFAGYSDGDADLSSGVVAVVIAVSLVLSYLSWRFVESPFRRRRVISTRRGMLTSSVTVLALFAAIGLGIQAAEGISVGASAEAASVPGTDHARTERQVECIVTGPELAGSIHVGSFCSYGDNSETPKFVLWGDSHANHLMPLFDDLSDGSDISGLHITAAGCLPILDAVQLDRLGCSGFNDAARSVLQNSDVQHVILASWWTLYLTDQESLFSAQTETAELDGDESGGNELFIDSVEKLLTDGFEVWLVRDNPNFEFDPNRRALGGERLGLDDRDSGISYSAYLRENELVDSIFAKLEIQGANIIDLPEVLCDGDFCPVVRDGVPLYRDQDHLSILGSRYVESAFDPLFDALVDRTPATN